MKRKIFAQALGIIGSILLLPCLAQATSRIECAGIKNKDVFYLEILGDPTIQDQRLQNASMAFTHRDSTYHIDYTNFKACHERAYEQNRRVLIAELAENNVFRESVTLVYFSEDSLIAMPEGAVFSGMISIGDFDPEGGDYPSRRFDVNCTNR